MSDASVALLGLGTAVPPALSQPALCELGVACCCDDDRQAAWLRRVYGQAGIDSRGSVLQQNDSGFTSFFPPRTHAGDRGPTTAVRMTAYADLAPPLAAEAAQQTIRAAAIAAESITHVITVSCTGFVAPGLDIAMIERLHLRPGVQRLHVGFMGCHAALNALAAARSIVRGDASAVVLVCCVELCTLHFAYGFDPQRIVANALFADGAAAAIVARERPDRPVAWRVRDAASLLLPNSREAMGWQIADHGYEMALSPRVPDLIAEPLLPWINDWLGRNAVRPSNVPHWAVHPGGPRILDAVQAALSLSAEQIAPSRRLLAEHGNMSSATVLFLLERLHRSKATGVAVALAFGPGLMMEAALLER